MHDEVSETENIRKNLSIERMIIEGCDILLDVNQTFVRQGKSSQKYTVVRVANIFWIKCGSLPHLSYLTVLFDETSQ